MSSLWAGEPAANPQLASAWSADGGLKKRHDAESGQSIARPDRKALSMAWQPPKNQVELLCVNTEGLCN